MSQQVVPIGEIKYSTRVVCRFVFKPFHHTSQSHILKMARRYDIDTIPTVNPEVLDHKHIYLPVAPVHTTPWQTEYTANYRWPSNRIARDDMDLSEPFKVLKEKEKEREMERKERAVDEAVQTMTRRVRDDAIQTSSNDHRNENFQKISIGTEMDQPFHDDNEEPVPAPHVSNA